MKRSEINAIIKDAESFIRKNGFFLPPFAYWTAEEWQKKGAEVREIVDNQIGWDITDFGSGDFEKVGLAIITIRNGHPDNLKGKKGKTYAEKILIVGVNQITPMHFHWTKAEDIINRGGGELVIQLYNSTPAEKLDTENDVVVQCDGVTRTVKPGGFIHLKPGESITLLSGQYHTFWAEKERVMVGEVSVVNDDRTDNRFYEPIGRFPIIEEDVPPLYLLTEDYKNYYKGA